MGKISKLLILLPLCSFLLISSSGIAITNDSLILQQIDSLLFIPVSPNDSVFNLSYKNSVKAIELSKSINHWKGEIKGNLVLGNFYLGYQKYYNALVCFLRVMDLGKANNDQRSVFEATERIGNVFTEISRFDIALKYFDQASEYLGIEKDPALLFRLHLNKGVYFIQTNETKKALTEFYLCYHFAAKQNDTLGISQAMKNIGIVFLHQKEYNSSIYYYQTAIKQLLPTNYRNEFGTLYTLIAHSYEALNNFDSAIYYYHLAKEIREIGGQTRQYYGSLLNLGNLFLESDMLDSAFYYLNAGIDPAERYSLTRLKEYGYLGLSKLFLKHHDYKKSLESFRKYTIARDSVLFEKNRIEISILETTNQISRFEQEKKLLETQIMLQQSEIKLKNRSTVIYLSIIVISIFIIFLVYFLYIKTKRSRQALQALNDQLDREVEERKKAEIALRISESSYRFLADHTPDVILQMDPVGQVIFASPNCREVLGYTAEELVDGFPFQNTVFPEYLEAMRGLYRVMVTTCEPTLFTYEALSKTGARFWVESLANPLTDPVTGKYNGCISVLRNIEERVKYEEQLAENAKQKEVLLREVHHRVKNNFAILIGVLTLQKSARHNPELANLVNDLELRIRSMSLVHELLYRNENLDFIPFDTYVVQLANIVAAANRSKTVHIIPNTKPCILDIGTALPLGLVVNELVTNSYKYAFTETEDGYLFIDLMPYETNPSGEPVKWILTIRDSGKGLPEGYTMDSTGTLGSQIVKMLVTQVEGSVRSVSNGGACFEIIFNQSPE